ncbi:hypothetical protein JVX91_05820 [Pseudomonas sp. PDNC002]|uniref:hypothetical protein n=1 Tax=Pseudomonas sp. PDNC002 TaxID=2811422 RepID=UPI00196600D3|nr:hypothetical protein [Pseudomonas sp. PDNC002]QRY80621.1 hypothetical protein JVX91_05820 [Pseudomonas sp. PDNC002]
MRQTRGAVRARASTYNKKAKEVTMTTTSPSLRQNVPGNVLFLLAALAYMTFHALGCFFIEADSYIYFRVAENIAYGFGYAFSIGDTPILSGSGPLWQYLLVLGVSLGCNVVVLAKAMGLMFGLGTLFVFYRVARPLSTPVTAGGLAIACVPRPHADGWLSALAFARREAFISVGVLYVLLSGRRTLAVPTLVLGTLTYGGYLVFRPLRLSLQFFPIPAARKSRREPRPSR